MQPSLFEDPIEWPVIITMYAHGRSETPSVKEDLEEYDFPEDWIDHHAYKLKSLTNEVGIDIECHEDGTLKVKCMYLT